MPESSPDNYANNQNCIVHANMHLDTGSTPPTVNEGFGRADTLNPGNCLVLFILALLILIPGTIGVSFVDRDEGWYAQVCREMLEAGNWLTPTYLGEIWLHKPPLLYWFVITSYKLFGMGEWQARLAPVLSTAINVVLVGMLGARMFNRRIGMLAGILFITCGLPAIVGKMLLTDAPMLTCTLIAVLLHWQMAADRVKHTRSIIYWLAIGIGILAKGPAVVVFVGAFGLALLSCHGLRNWIWSWRYWLWFPLCLFVALPWYVYINQQAGGTLAEDFLWYEIFSRIKGTPHGHGGPPGMYILLSFAGLLPWTPLIPTALVTCFKQRKTDRNIRLLLIWLAVPWIVLELIHSKLPHYIVPCYVPLAILFARQLAPYLDSLKSWPSLDDNEKRMFNIWIAVLVILAIPVVFIAVGSRNPAAIIPAGLFAFGFALTGWIMRRRPLKTAWTCAVTTTIALHLTIGFGLLPAVEPLRLSRNLATAINNMAEPDDRIYLCGYPEPSTFFYLNHPGREIGAGQIEQLLDKNNQNTKGQLILAITQRRLDRLDSDLRQRLEPLVKQYAIQGFNYVKGRTATIWLSRHTHADNP